MELTEVLFHHQLSHSSYWHNYLQTLGWTTINCEKMFVFSKKLPFSTNTVIRIQRSPIPIPFREVDTLAKTQKAICVIIEPHIIQYDEKSFLTNGYFTTNFWHSETATSRIDLRMQLDDISGTLSPNARRNIRANEKHKTISILQVDMRNKKREDYFDLFYQMYILTANRKQFRPMPFHKLKEKMRALKNCSVILFAVDKSTHSTIGAYWFVLSKPIMYYLYSGMTQRGYDLSIGYNIMWEAIKFGNQHRFEGLDLGQVFDQRYSRVFSGAKAYTEFKQRFRGIEVFFPTTWVKPYNRFFELAIRYSSLFPL